MSKPEQRFRDHTGSRFLKNGNVRCHALSKSQIRKWREEYSDYDTPSDELWPECQCTRPAAVGMYVCYWHGGESPTSKPRDILDVMPIDLAEKFKTLSEHPDYISQQETILLYRARKWELLEELSKTPNVDETRGMLAEALVALRKGDDLEAANLIESALTSDTLSHQAWDEIYRLDNMLNKTIDTEVKSAKELRLMATVQQVGYLVQNLFRAIQDGAAKYIDDGHKRTGFLLFMANELERFANFGPGPVIRAIEGSSDTINGATE